MTKEELIAFETDIKNIYLAGAIHSPVHLSGGDEDQLIEIFKAIKKDDWVFGTHRSHYLALLKGVSPELVKVEILAGRSMSLNFKEYKFFTSSIVGGCLPIAVGVAMAIKRKGDNNKVWCIIGDMAAETGIFYECYKYSYYNKLPIKFVVEDNGLSVQSPTQLSWGNKDGDDVFPGIIYGYYLRRFKYERQYPHQGCAKWVIF